jgi:hypothetical protein
VSRDEAERLRFWSGRKNAFPASGRISPDYMCMDSTIPRKRLADILLAIQEMEKKYQLRCANVFHAGDGNLHPLILFDANDPDQLHRCELFGADILETSVAMGGTVTGEHGVGVEKLNSMCVQFSADRKTSRCSASSAPSTARACSIPGKVIPTLNRCAEYGKDAGARRADQAPGPAAFLAPASAMTHDSAARTGLVTGFSIDRRTALARLFPAVSGAGDRHGFAADWPARRAGARPCVSVRRLPSCAPFVTLCACRRGRDDPSFAGEPVRRAHFAGRGGVHLAGLLVTVLTLHLLRDRGDAPGGAATCLNSSNSGSTCRPRRCSA